MIFVTGKQTNLSAEVHLHGSSPVAVVAGIRCRSVVVTLLDGISTRIEHILAPLRERFCDSEEG
jgi:hypothetical protein